MYKKWITWTRSLSSAWAQRRGHIRRHEPGNCWHQRQVISPHFSAVTWMASYPLLANKETTTRDVHSGCWLGPICAGGGRAGRVTQPADWPASKSPSPTPPTVSGIVYFNFPGQQWQALSSSSLLQSPFSSTILTCLSIQVLSRLLFSLLVLYSCGWFSCHGSQGT